MKPVKIACTGAHGVGKTTLLDELKRDLTARQLKFNAVLETPRVVCEIAKDPQFFRRGSNTLAKQSLLLQSQIQSELRCVQDSPQLIVCDRALLDHWIYTLHFHRELLEASNALMPYAAMIAEHCRTYDMLFYVPIEFAPVDDGVREGDVEFQQAIDFAIQRFLEEHGLKFIVLKGTVAERCAAILTYLEQNCSGNFQKEPQEFHERMKAESTRIGIAAQVSDASSAYCQVLAHVLATAHEVKLGDSKSTRSDELSKEILNYNVVIANPRERVIQGHRPTNLLAAVPRFIWMMAGNDRLKDIQFYEDKVASFTDDGIVVPGSSYGHRMLYVPAGCNQVRGALERLRAAQRDGKGTRRAAIAIYHPEDAVRDSRDIPCTFGLTFHNREGYLHTTITMRSNNATSLLPYNLFEFSMLGEVIAAEVGLELGAMSYSAMSMHVYAKDYQGAQKVVDTAPSLPVCTMPEMPRSPSPVNQVNELVKLEADARHAAAGFCEESFAKQWVELGKSKLHPYWQQLYFILLLAMCRKVNFQKGTLVLRELITDPWKSYLPADAFETPKPVEVQMPIELDDLFSHAARRLTVSTLTIPIKVEADHAVGDSIAVSREELEKEFDGVLKLYKDFVARDQWSDILSYRDEFLGAASRSPEVARRAIDQLRRLRFPLLPNENVEANRGPASKVIDELRKIVK